MEWFPGTNACPLTISLSAFSAAELPSTEQPLRLDSFSKDAFETVHHTSVTVFYHLIKK